MPQRLGFVIAALFSLVALQAQAASGTSGFAVVITLNAGALPPLTPGPPAPPDQLPVDTGQSPVLLPPTAGPVVIAPPPAPAVDTGAGTPSMPVSAPRPDPAPAPAGMASASDSAVVSPMLMVTSGICTSLTERYRVQVVCSTGQFVSIEPSPGQVLEGAHGAAYRFAFGPDTTFLTGFRNFRARSGTVTALRLTRAADSKTSLEMLVSF